MKRAEARRARGRGSGREAWPNLRRTRTPSDIPAMNSRNPIVVSWSGGKDSALALDALRRDPAWDVVGLLTSVTQPYDRISVHGVRRSLLLAQAASLGVPVTEIV